MIMKFDVKIISKNEFNFLYLNFSLLDCNTIIKIIYK